MTTNKNIKVLNYLYQYEYLGKEYKKLNLDELKIILIGAELQSIGIYKIEKYERVLSHYFETRLNLNSFIKKVKKANLENTKIEFWGFGAFYLEIEIEKNELLQLLKFINFVKYGL